MLHRMIHFSCATKQSYDHLLNYGLISVYTIVILSEHDATYVMHVM